MCEDEKLTGFVKNVADAIREVEGSSDQIRPVDFPERIKNLSSSSPSGFVYNVNTVNKTSVPTADLEKLKSDPNAMIIETYTIAPVNFKIYYRKMFKSGDTYDRFVSVYSTANEEHINQTTLRAYRDLNYATSTLSKKRTVNIVNEDQLAAYLRRPTDNPTKDSLVAVSSNGGISWQPIDDFLQKDSTETPYDQVYFKNTDGSNIMRNVRSVPDAYVMPITNDKGQLKTNDPEVELDCVNKQYLEANYNGNPALAGTEVELTGIMMGGTKYKVPNGGFVYKINTSAELTIAAEDLAKIKADNNAIIVEIDTTRPSAETRFYKKGIDFIGGTVFVSIYTVVGAEVAEGCSIAYRELNPTTGVLTARHETNATSLAEVRQEIEGKYLPKPSGNPTEDSLVKVSSAGTSSWQPVSDFLARPTSAANSDRVCIIPDGQTKFGYRNAYKTVYNVENVMVIRDVRGTVPQPDPQREQDGVNLRYLQANYNANPTLDGTETELTGVTLNGTKYKVPSGGGSVDTSNFIKKSGVPEISNIRYQVIGEGANSPSHIFLYDSTYRFKGGGGIILHSAESGYNRPFLSIGSTGSATDDGASVFSQMGPNGLSSSSNNYIVITNQYITRVVGVKRYEIEFPNAYAAVDKNVSAIFCTNKTLKTLFGNKNIFSVDGTGNIDLYRHHIVVTGKNDPSTDWKAIVHAEIISSENIAVASLTDFQSLVGSNFYAPASGVYAVGGSTDGFVVGITDTGIQLHSNPTSETFTFEEVTWVTFFTDAEQLNFADTITTI